MPSEKDLQQLALSLDEDDLGWIATLLWSASFEEAAFLGALLDDSRFRPPFPFVAACFEGLLAARPEIAKAGSEYPWFKAVKWPQRSRALTASERLQALAFAAERIDDSDIRCSFSSSVSGRPELWRDSLKEATLTGNLREAALALDAARSTEFELELVSLAKKRPEPELQRLLSTQ